MPAIYDPALVVGGLRSWLVAQIEPDPETGDSPNRAAYVRCLKHLDELVTMWMQPGSRMSTATIPKRQD